MTSTLAVDARPGPAYVSGARVSYGAGPVVLYGTIQAVRARHVDVVLDEPLEDQTQVTFHFSVLCLVRPEDEPSVVVPPTPAERAARLAAVRQAIVHAADAQARGTQLSDLLAMTRQTLTPDRATWAATQEALVQALHAEFRQLDQATAQLHDLQVQRTQFESLYAQHYDEVVELGVAPHRLPPSPTVTPAGKPVRRPADPQTRRKLRLARQETRRALVVAFLAAGSQGLSKAEMFSTLCQDEAGQPVYVEDGTTTPLPINEERVLGVLSALSRWQHVEEFAVSVPPHGLEKRWRATPALGTIVS